MKLEEYPRHAAWLTARQHFPYSRKRFNARPCLTAPATYHIQVYGQALVTASDAGSYGFLISRAPPVGGQTNGGFFTWETNNPQPFYHAEPYAVVATVKNKVSANQNHSVEVDLDCTDANGDSLCGAVFSNGELRVDVFVP